MDRCQKLLNSLLGHNKATRQHSSEISLSFLGYEDKNYTYTHTNLGLQKVVMKQSPSVNDVCILGKWD